MTPPSRIKPELKKNQVKATDRGSCLWICFVPQPSLSPCRVTDAVLGTGQTSAERASKGPVWSMGYKVDKKQTTIMQDREEKGGHAVQQGLVKDLWGFLLIRSFKATDILETHGVRNCKIVEQACGVFAKRKSEPTMS